MAAEPPSDEETLLAYTTASKFLFCQNTTYVGTPRSVIVATTELSPKPVLAPLVSMPPAAANRSAASASTPPKPAPDPLLAAIGRLGLSRASAVYVGDSMVDLETGRAARVRTVLAAWGLTADLRATFRSHRLWATRPSQMLALVLTPPNGNGHKRAA